MRFFIGMLGSDLRFNRGRLALLALIIVAALFTYVALGAILGEMRSQALALWRLDSPYDISAYGSSLDVDAINSIPGIVRTEKALVTEVIVGSGSSAFFSLPPGQVTFALSMSQGRMPQGPAEIALPAQVAGSLGVTVGDRFSVLPTALSDATLSLTVSGIFDAKAGTPKFPVVTEDTLRSISPAPGDMLFVTLDGSADIKHVATAIAKAMPSAKVETNTDQYEGIQEGGGLAGDLVTAIRGLVLVITCVALGALILLVQRQRSFEFGLLKAIGASNAWVIVPACLNILLVFAVGAPLTWLALIGARPLLRAPQLSVLYSNWLSGSVLFTVLGLIIALLVTAELITREAATLLNDPWGRG